MNFSFLRRRKNPRILDMREACEVFDELADTEDLALSNLRNGCQLRERKVAEVLSVQGLKTKTAWAFKGRTRLYVKLPGHGQRPLRWWFHVAAALPVRMPDGKVQDLVFDPGIFDGPVTLEEWGRGMNAPKEKLAILPEDTPPPAAQKNQTVMEIFTRKNGLSSLQVQKCLERMGHAQARQTRVVLSSSLRLKEEAPTGENWVSVRAPKAEEILRTPSARAFSFP